MTRRSFLALSLAALVAVGCAFVPQRNLRLEEARRSYQVAAADPQIAARAPAELREAADILEQADLARDTLDDVAVVDHLAYLARQRVKIARESAKLRANSP